jgi:hypothetical protein
VGRQNGLTYSRAREEKKEPREILRIRELLYFSVFLKKKRAERRLERRLFRSRAREEKKESTKAMKIGGLEAQLVPHPVLE